MNPRPSDPPISLIARSPGLDAQAVDVVVTMPTFRRPKQVLETLASLERQRTQRRFAVIVMENDAEGREGVTAAGPWFESGRIPGLLIIAHERGNCSAYNAGWLTALIQFPTFRHLLVIDDDEIADPDWLERMCRAAETLPADIVGGPQLPVFDNPAHQHWESHPVFSTPYKTSGLVPALYSSGNLLIGRHVLEKMGSPFLELAFNFMGGGDSDFLSRSAAAGFRLGWCAEAPVYEAVPERRVEADWIRARALRNGVISTLVEKRKRAADPFGRVKVAARSLALLGASPLRAAARYASTGSASIALYPIYVALGRIGAEFGYANEQYRTPEKN
jgi:glycosyltransferase involved in cell wall biosynthesis